jgi:hypothetical protein
VSGPPIPALLEQLGRRPFSFYPPIVNVEHNEWILRRVNWSEVQVMNTKSGTELVVPRRFLGEVSSVEEPILLMGLVKELEYRSGAVLPHIRRVIEMPRAVNDSPRPRIMAVAAERPAPVVGIRLEDSRKVRTTRLIMAAAATGMLACVGMAIIFRDGGVGSRTRLSVPAQRDIPFTWRDDYDSVVAAFGPPAEDSWRAVSNVHYRRLWYPKHSAALILIDYGNGRVHYAGAVDSNGRLVHWVRLPSGQTSAALLKRL